jgi:ribosomal protein S11
MSQKLLHSIYISLLCMVLLVTASVSSAAPIPHPPAVTQRINFAPGGTSATVVGQVDGTSLDTYLLNARANQYMQVSVTSASGNVYLTVVSPFGSPLARAQAGAQSYAGTLPENGDYTLQVSAPSGTPLTSYSLTVSVTGTGQPTQPAPPPQPVAGPTTRINFPPGGTSAQVTGQVGGFVVNYYLVNAQAGQQMQASVTSPGNNVFMTVAAPSGAILASAPAGAKSYSGTLPESGDYTLRISTIPGGALTNYTVSVSISGLVQPVPPSGNQRIQFAAGATSATVNGQVSGDVFNGYVINAQANQRMRITLMSYSLTNFVYITLISPGGSPLARAQAGAQSFDGILPESGDYTIQVSAPAGTTTTAYSLVVTVTNSAPPTNTTERFSFATGTNSALVYDQIDGSSLDTYLINASAGQRMQISLVSPGNNVYLTLVSPGGSPLARAQNGAQGYDQALPESGDYQLQISAPAGTTQTTYSFEIIITGSLPQPPPPVSGSNLRIQFAPGATSAQVSGQVDGNTYVGYVLNARAGQHMQINVASPGGNVYLTLVSPGGSPLARAQAGAQSFNGILPESGDYTVQISAPSGTAMTTFLVTVAIT